VGFLTTIFYVETRQITSGQMATS